MFRRLILDLRQRSPDPALRVAAELAARLKLDLVGVFVEDSNLLGLAALPFAREIRPSAGTWHAIAADDMARDLALAARRAERRFAALTRELGRAAQFERRQGSPADAIQDLSRHDDVIVVLEPASPAERYAHAFASMVAAAFRSAATVLIVPARVVRDSGPIVALATGPDDPTIAAAMMLADALGSEAVVLDSRASGLRRLEERMIVAARGTLADAALSELAETRLVPVLVIEPPVAAQPD
jgi:hypothetical protein